MTKPVRPFTPHGRFLRLVTRPGGRSDEKGVLLPLGLTGQTAGVTVSDKRIIVAWAGGVPSTLVSGVTWRVPYDPKDNSSLTFTLNRTFFRIETTAASAVRAAVEKSPGGNAAFVASTVNTLSVAAGSYEDDHTGLSVAVSSGELLRITFLAVPGTTFNYQVQVSGVTT